MKTKHCLLQGLLTVLLLSASLYIQAQNNFNNPKIGPQHDGSILVPSNQLLRPAGFQLYMPGRPVDISLISDEHFLLVKNMNSLDLIQLSDRSIMQSLPYDKGGSSFTGICSSKDNRHIYVSEASDKVLIARFDQSNVLSWDKPILMPKPAIGGDPGPGGLALNAKEDRLFVTLGRNNSLAVINLTDQSIDEIPVGIAPYDILLCADSNAYVTKYYDIATSGSDNGNNWIELRLADVYLLYAEALVRTNGDKGSALNYLNKIRQRARNTPGDPNIQKPVDLLKDYKLSDFATDQAFLLAIEKERRSELAFESHRWFDLVRTGRAKDVMISKQASDGYTPFVWSNDMLVYPIPMTVMQSNPGKIIQNKGYTQL